MKRLFSIICFVMCLVCANAQDYKAIALDQTEELESAVATEAESTFSDSQNAVSLASTPVYASAGQPNQLNLELQRAKLRRYSKNYLIVGLTVGPVLMIAGAALIGISATWELEHDGKYQLWSGISAAALGVATTTFCSIQSYKYHKRAQVLTASVWSHELDLHNGMALNVGLDMIGRGDSMTKTLGLGVRFSF